MPRIEPGDDASQPHLTLVADRSLGDLGAEASVSLYQCNTAKDTLRRRLFPTRLLRRGIEHTQTLWILAQQLAAVLVGVLSGGVRHLVDEALPAKHIL